MRQARSAHDVQASNESLKRVNPAQKALWFIESHLADALTLDEIAGIAGVSRFHLVRAFGAATGFSVMRYVRARRLTEAARALARGTPNILNVALDADYGSHEAFTRAFRDHFGITPEAVRSSTCLDHLKLQEPIQMNSTLTDNLQAPRFETGKAFLVAGVGDRFSQENGAGIPGLWQRFQQTAALPAGSGRWPTAFAATATMPAISTISPASKCRNFLTCRPNFPRFAFPSSVTRSSLIVSTSRPYGAPLTPSGITGCRPRA
jgi:AraC-like DNA-binding protein